MNKWEIGEYWSEWVQEVENISFNCVMSHQSSTYIYVLVFIEDFCCDLFAALELGFNEIDKI